MHKLCYLLGAAALLACSTASNASYLIDTGSGTLDYAGPDTVWTNDSSRDSDFYAIGARFTVSEQTTVNRLEAYMHWQDYLGVGGSGDPLTVELRRADAINYEYGSGSLLTGMPGTVVASKAFSVAASPGPMWHRFDLSAELAAGTYWITLSDYYDGSPTDLFFGTMPGGAPRPMEGYISMISNSFSAGIYVSDDAGFGFRVSAVPEPHGAALAALGLACLSALRLRSSARGSEGRSRP